MNLSAIVRRHPVVAYFGMAFTISWVGALILVAPRIISGQPIGQTYGLLMFPVMLLGPSLAGVTCSGLADGKRGIANLFDRLRRWRVGPAWFAAALLLPPLLILTVLLTLDRFASPAFAPRLFPFSVLFGIIAGFFEEIGWTGFAFPALRATRSALTAGIELGVLWGLWHWPVIDYLGTAYPHGPFWLYYFLAFIAVVTAMRVLIAWVYSNSTSLLLAQLMHASSTGFLAMFSPAPISPAQEALWYAVYAVLLWLVVALVSVRYGQDLVHPRPDGKLLEVHR